MRIAILLLVLFSCAKDSKEISLKDIKSAEKIAALNFTDSERDSLLNTVQEQTKSITALRKLNLDNSVVNSLQFNPLPMNSEIRIMTGENQFTSFKGLKKPENLNDLAFYSIGQLAELIKTKQISSIELTRFFIDRLKRYDSQLQAVITITEQRAMDQAMRMDDEIRNGKYRGILHGIPYGAKDLLAVEGYKTTWGAAPYKDQQLSETATVIKKLDDAGAILIAKLSLGALAWGDVWFGGKTKNPWHIDQGSSGSSAGPGSATAAGLVPFAIGTETWGSIVSPSSRNGITGLRPTFGRVSRYGAMALSWSMDKIGPMARSVEDCAIVFDIIRGTDHRDLTVHDFPFYFHKQVDLSNYKIGYHKSEFDSLKNNKTDAIASLDILRKLGATLIPIELPDFPVNNMSFLLSVEGAAAFEELTLTNRDDLLVRQIRNAWPNVFRESRFVSAVDYIQANRARTLLIEKMAEVMKKIDVYITPSFGNGLLLTNLTGHPQVVLPNGFDDSGSPANHSISFVGQLYNESDLLNIAHILQEATNFHKTHPEAFKK